MKCPTCPRKMEMYYVPWCPWCEKPVAKPEPILNLIKALRHLEVIGHEGIKDRIWDTLWNSYEFRNDTFITIHLDDEHLDADLLVLKQAFDIGDNIIVEVSW